MSVLVLAVMVCLKPFSAESSDFTGKLGIFFTADIHGEFKKLPKVAHEMKKMMKSYPSNILVDAGDWAEGSMYYTLSGNDFMLEYFRTMKYDAIQIGNHDWLSGADELFASLSRYKDLTFLSANLDFRKYVNRSRPENLIPYTILEKNGVKIGLVGLSPYGFIHDYFFKPVKIIPPIENLKKVVRVLRPEVDVIIVIGHDFMSSNIASSTVGGIDLFIGSHDHTFIAKPIYKKLPDGHRTMFVDIGAHVKYFGLVEITFDKGRITERKYKPIALKPFFAENREIKKLYNNLEKKLKIKHGDDIDKPIAKSLIALNKDGLNNGMGNLLADAYQEETGADLALAHSGFVHTEMRVGDITTRDVFHYTPHVYKTSTGKSWTVKIIRLTGEQLLRMLNAGLTLNDAYPKKGMTLSSTVKALFRTNLMGMYDTKNPTIKSLSIKGKKLENDKIYSIAVSDAMILAMKLFNQITGFEIKYIDIKDTDKEVWKVFLSYIKKHSPIIPRTIKNPERLVPEK